MSTTTDYRHKRSSVPGKVPTTGQLDFGMIGINTADGKLFFKSQDSAGAPEVINELSSGTTVADATITLSAGDGIITGGSFTTNQAAVDTITFTMGTPSTLTSSTTNGVTATSHTHTIDETGFSIASTQITGVLDSARFPSLDISADTHGTLAYSRLSGAPTVYAEPGIFSGGGTPTLASGVTGAEVRSLIGAGTSSTVGTVTSVAAGNGLNFTTINSSGSVTLGTPSSLTSSSTNSVGASTHAHEITSDFVAGQTQVTELTDSDKFIFADGTDGDNLKYATLGDIQTNTDHVTVYDTSGGLNINTVGTVVLDTEAAASDSSVYTLLSGEFTFDIAMTPALISYSCSTDVSSGTARSSSYSWLEIDTGGGYAEIAGTRGFMYNRITSAGENTASKTITRQINAGDKIRMRAARLSGTDTIITKALGSNLTVINLKGGRAGPIGPAGGGTVTNVAAGNGLDFTGITSTGSVTLGTPGTLTSSTTNGVTATSHTHTIDETGFTIATSQLTGTIDSASLPSLHVASDTHGDIPLGTRTSGSFVQQGATSGSGISGSVNTEAGTFTVTSNATDANSNSTLVFRDGSGNFAAGTITAALSGNATTATTATQVGNAATFNNGGAGAASGTTFDGAATRTISYNTIGASPLASPTFTGIVTAPDLTLTALGADVGTTSLMITGNVVGTRTLGSNAFTSTTIPAAANDATITIAAGNGLLTGGAFTTDQSGNETITLNFDSSTNITGNATTATTATNANNVNLADTNNATTYPVLSEGATSNQALKTDTAYNYNATTQTLVVPNLTVNGTTTTINTETLTIDDNIIVLNNNEAGTPSQNSGIEIERGTSANKTFIWDEGADQWTVGSETMVAATFVGALTGNASTATTAAAWTTGRTITLTGDVTGVSGSFDGSGNLSFATVVGNDTHTHNANNLTGTTLNSGVTASSLTSVGTLSSLTSSGVVTLSGLSNQAAEATAVMINGSNVVGTRELGSNAFTSTAIPAAANDATITLSAGNGLITGGAFTTDQSGNETITFTMGTPGTTTSASTNAVTATSHTHALGSISAADLTSGTLDSARIPSLDVSADTHGSLAYSRVSGTPTIGNGTLTLATSGVGLSGSTSFTANQSGAGSFTVTSNATSANTASAIVARDGSGNFTAGTITAALSGNASTATTAAAWTTGRTITLTGDVTGVSGSFDGSGNLSFATVVGNDTHTHNANNLTGTTLNSGVVTSSLTTVGTIGTGTWQGGVIASAYLDADTMHLSGTQTVTGAKTFSSTALNHTTTTTPIFTVKTSAASSQDAIFRLGGARTASSTSDIAKIEFMNIANSRAEIVMRDPAGASGSNDGSLILRTYDAGVAQDALTLVANGDATFGGTIAGTSFSGSIIVGGHTMNDIDITSEYSGANDHLMTSQAINNRILDFGYSTTTGTVTSVSGGTGLSSTGGTTPSISHDAHTGDVTGSTALTIAADVVTYAKMQNVVADDRILGNVAGAGGIVAELTAAQVRTMINVADGATANTGTVTSVAAGNGMTFTSITGTGSVTMGTPGTLTGATTNGVTTNAHTHAITTNGTGDIVGTGSPTFTGNPTAPTPAPADNDTSIATTAFVQTEIAAIPPSTLTVNTVSTSTAMVQEFHYHLTDSGQTMTLPMADSEDYLELSVRGFDNTIVARNGNNIMGLAEDMTLDVAYSSTKFKFIDSNYGWFVSDAASDVAVVQNNFYPAQADSSTLPSLNLAGGVDTHGILDSSQIPSLDLATDVHGSLTTDSLTTSDAVFTGAIKEQQYSLTGTAIDPANGTIQYKTLASNTTFTESLADGNSVTLMITADSAYTVTWPTITWMGTDSAAVAPALQITGYTGVVLFQMNGIVYGSCMNPA